MMTPLITGLLTTAILAGGVIALAALGELLAERVGVFNLGLEGLMSLGAITAIITAAVTAQPYIAFGAALALGLALGVVFAAATVLLRANQVLCGLAFTFLGVGVAAWIGEPYAGQVARAQFGPLPIPLLSDIPILGPAIFHQNILVYLTYFILPPALYLLLFKTRHGINLRAVGENPAAADAAGVPVLAMRFWYVAAGAALTTSAGAYLTLAFVPAWSAGLVAGRGWIAIGLVVFANYQPLNIVAGAILFGVLSAFGYAAQAQNWPIPATYFAMMPYLGTIAFMFAQAALRRGGRRWIAAPAALGLPYFRDER
jgi:simple sugar transport system permease protein